MTSSYILHKQYVQYCAHAINRWVVLSLLIVCLVYPLTSLGAADRSTEAENHANNGLDLAQAGDLVAAEAELRHAVRLAPRNADFLADLGTVLAMERKLGESTDVLKQALRLDSSNLTARQHLGANLWQLHRYVEAKEELEVLLKKKPGDKPATLLLGMVSENMKDYAAAARLLGSVPALVREQPESIAALARSFYRTGRKEKGRAALQQLLTHPAGPPGVLLGAQIADEMHDYATAEKLLVSIKPLFADQATVGYQLALVQYHAKGFVASQRTLQNLVDSGYKSGKVLNLLGWCYQQQYLVEKAVSAFDQSIALEPEQESNYLDLANILLINRSLPAALKVANRTTEAFRNSPEAFGLKGSVELKLGQFNDAIDSYRKALHIDAANSDAALGLAEAQSAAGLTNDAIASFEASLKQYPKDARFRLQYALMLLKESETGNAVAEVRAEQLLKSAIALNPSLPGVHYYLGDLALKKGQIAEAVWYLERAAKIDAESAQVHFALSRAYRRVGRKQEASREMAFYQNLKESESTLSPDDLSPQ
jgi:tetratricopeptide (TPR) repeat protein